MQPSYNQKATIRTSWQEWERIYARELEHPANYELRFAREILQKMLPRPYNAIPQYHFKDSGGKDRYIDFMIVFEDSIFVAIELDGLSKMIDYDNTHEERYARFNDFLYRQNEVIKRFGVVLRYSNKYWQANPNQVIQDIRQEISKQIPAVKAQQQTNKPIIKGMFGYLV